MAIELKNELLQYCKDSEDLRKLVALLDQAVAKNKYIIHFGIERNKKRINLFIVTFKGNVQRGHCP